MYKNSFLYSCKKNIFIRYSPKSIGFVRRWPVIYILNLSSVEWTVWTLSCSLTYTHAHNSNFFTIRILSLYSIYSENKKESDRKQLWLITSINEHTTLHKYLISTLLINQKRNEKYFLLYLKKENLLFWKWIILVETVRTKNAWVTA